MAQQAQVQDRLPELSQLQQLLATAPPELHTEVLCMVLTNEQSLSDHTPLLLLRGLTHEQRHWGGFVPILAEKLPNPLLCFDFAGAGELYQQCSPTTISGLRQSVRSQWQQHKSAQKTARVHLLALSLGGMLATDWALAYPDEVASVTLINSSARPLAPFYQRLRWQQYPAIASLFWLSAASREQRILQLTSARAYQNPAIVANWQRWQQQKPVSMVNTLRQLFAASRFKLLQPLACPTLVISSQADKLVNPHCSVALANFLVSVTPTTPAV